MESAQKKPKFKKCTSNLFNGSKGNYKGGVGKDNIKRVGESSQINDEKDGLIENSQWGPQKILKLRITKLLTVYE